MNNKVKLALLSGLLASPTFADARTADEVLAVSADPTVQGKEIAIEGDSRDDGFVDSETTLKMVLRNAQGQESIRELRTRVFEMEDKSVGDKSMSIFDRPRDVEGTAFLTFSKILDPDDQWMYLPELGRVKRISSKNKSGPFMGSEFAYEDISSQEVDKYTYKFIAREACPASPELACLKVERYPAYKHSGYTKQIVWVDEGEFLLRTSEFYDRKGELLKTLQQKEYKLYLGKYWRPHLMTMVNHQTGKSTDLSYSEYKFRTGLKESSFSRSKLSNVR